MKQPRKKSKPTQVPYLLPKILKLSDDELGRATMHCAIDILIDVSGDPNRKIRSVPPEWRSIYVMFRVATEVPNGGFHQLFTNLRGAFDDHILEDVARLPHNGYRRVIRKAFAEYRQIDYTDQWRNIGKSWDYFCQPYKEGRFKSCDKAFYALSPNLFTVVGKYIRDHFSEFCHPDDAQPSRSKRNRAMVMRAKH